MRPAGGCTQMLVGGGEVLGQSRSHLVEEVLQKRERNERARDRFRGVKPCVPQARVRTLDPRELKGSRPAIGC